MSEIQHKTGFVILITLVATIGGFLFGFDSGVINGTVKGLQSAFNSDSVGTGFNVASMLLGCAVGAFAAGRLADQFGRRSILLISAIFFTISAWGSGISASSGEFIVYRVLGGLAVSGISMWGANFIITITFPMLLSGIGLGGAYSIYAAFALASLFFVLKFVRETKGLELEEMQG